MSGIRIGPTHQDDGTGLCAVCRTEWPAECHLEKNTAWFAEGDVR